MIIDTSALLAYFDSSEPRHAQVGTIIDTTSELLVVSPYVLAELDYLILTRHGSHAEAAALRELSSGAWELADMPLQRLKLATEVVRRFADQPIGLADAANLVLAEAFGTRTIVTLDHRHFDMLRFTDNTAPIVLPGHG
ncbi:MAG: PIN domain-containing protein [Nocardioidaceae bacterium]